MRVREQLGLNVAPIALRVMLAVTFFWAGLGKVVATAELGPEQAARLANIGGPADAPAPPTPGIEIPDPQQPSADGEPQASAGYALHLAAQDSETQADPEPSPDPADAPPAEPEAEVRAYTAADFPDGIEVRRLYGLALQIDAAAFPAMDDESVRLRRLWPQTMGEQPWPVALAWAAAITELVVGVTLLIGLLTRLSALQIIGIMGVAIWLTQIGPAIQSGNTQLGFLPAHGAFDIAAWKTLAWQVSLLASGFALMLLGPGSASMDGLLFGRSASPAPKAKRDRANP